LVLRKHLKSIKINGSGERTRTADLLIFDNIRVKLARALKVNTNEQRIDSVHFKSNMRRLGRIGIFSQTINKFSAEMFKVITRVLNQKTDNLTIADLQCDDQKSRERPLGKPSGD
jgi:hypothetical protein